MSLFVRPRLSTLAVGVLALGFAALNHRDPLFVVLFGLLGLAEVALAFWNPSRRLELQQQVVAEVEGEAQKVLAPVEAKATVVLTEAKSLASQAQADVKAVEADAQKVLSPTEQIAADIASELKKA